MTAENILEIVIDNEPLEHDIECSLVCKTRDGLYHRVMNFPYPTIKPSDTQRVVRAERRNIVGRKCVILIEVD